jgi:hypothetical protein
MAETLLKDVKRLIEQPEYSLELTSRDAYTAETHQFTELIVSLSDMLSLFPKAEGGANKEDLDRAVDLARLSLDAMERVSARKEGALLGKEKHIAGRLLVCVATVDGWDGRTGSSPDKMSGLRARILQVLIGGLKHRIEETFIAVQKFEDGVLSTDASLREMVSLASCKQFVTKKPRCLTPFRYLCIGGRCIPACCYPL